MQRQEALIRARGEEKESGRLEPARLNFFAAGYSVCCTFR